MARRDIGQREAGPFQESDLKICDLCGSLNLTANAECFVCGWRGRFERGSEVVKIAMKLAESRYGRLARSLFTRDDSEYRERPNSLLRGLTGAFDRVRHWFLG